jgi:hypothetical protein
MQPRMISLALGCGRMVADLEITTSITEDMTGIDAARFLRYLGSFVPLCSFRLTRSSLGSRALARKTPAFQKKRTPRTAISLTL